MLRAAGLTVEPMPSVVDERAAEEDWPSASPAEVARRLAEAKALAVASGVSGRLVLGADQTLASGGERFSKADTIDEARARLQRLRGRRHALHSGFALARDGKVLASGVSSAHLIMRDFSTPFLEDYLRTLGDEVLGSVGCYQLEGIGVTLFASIEGDYFTILGLPLLKVLDALRSVGFIQA